MAREGSQSNEGKEKKSAFASDVRTEKDDPVRWLAERNYRQEKPIAQLDEFTVTKLGTPGEDVKWSKPTIEKSSADNRGSPEENLFQRTIDQTKVMGKGFFVWFEGLGLSSRILVGSVILIVLTFGGLQLRDYMRERRERAALEALQFQSNEAQKHLQEAQKQAAEQVNKLLRH